MRVITHKVTCAKCGDTCRSGNQFKKRGWWSVLFKGDEKTFPYCASCLDKYELLESAK